MKWLGFVEGLFEAPLSPCCKEPVEHSFGVLANDDPLREENLAILLAWTCRRCGQEGGTFIDTNGARLLKKSLVEDETL